MIKTKSQCNHHLLYKNNLVNKQNKQFIEGATTTIKIKKHLVAVYKKL